MWRVAPILLLCVLAGCGGRGLVSNNATSPTAPVTSSSSNSGSSPTSSSVASGPTAITVAAGQNIAGADITVTPPASSQPPNAEDLGVNPLSGLGMASNTGGTIHRGSTMRILLFGPGLNSQMQVVVAGPSDITVSNVQSTQATDKTPGLAFFAAVAGNAALGARTIYLKNPNGDVTSFAGGLEVIP